MSRRNQVIDAMKGLAIIAVVIYHFGGNYLPFGYLGVDIFFVIGGYLLIKQLQDQLNKGEFHYWRFLFRKIVRLWPLVVMVSCLSLLAGYFLMLPDDYENLAESVVASSIFSNNILLCITTGNYWDVLNFYKPLMHLWYVGVLMQAYIVLPLIYLAAVKICKNVKKTVMGVTIVLTLASLVLFLLPIFRESQKFYFLPFRVFEITMGGLLLFNIPDFKYKRPVSVICLLVLLIMLFSRGTIVSGPFMLILCAAASLGILAFTLNTMIDGVCGRIIGAFAQIGKRSYSIYIWHQALIAFLFYAVFPKQNGANFLIFILLTAVVSMLSYRFIEGALGKCIRNKKKEACIILCCIAAAVISSCISLLIYKNAGVVRDVPELNISKDNVHRHMHAEYNERPYLWRKDFEDNGKKHILVMGNSFGRDWSNILYEWDDSLDISYLLYTSSNIKNEMDRVEMADYVFYALGPEYEAVPDLVLENVDKEKLYIIGNKNYGVSNGIIYSNRGKADYYDQTVILPPELIEQNRLEKANYGDHYVDMIEIVAEDDDKIRVFTDDNMLISQDCLHLTQAGAQYYSRELDGRIREILGSD